MGGYQLKTATPEEKAFIDNEPAAANWSKAEDWRFAAHASVEGLPKLEFQHHSMNFFGSLKALIILTRT